jgi:hypothetical protein
MHKFVQRNHVKIFRNERTRSTLLHSNSYFGAFRTISLQHELWCKTSGTGAINTQVRAMKSCRNFSQKRHLIHPIWTQTHVLGHFGPFRYCQNFGTKRAELERSMHSFVQQSRVGIFRNERTQSTPLDPKLIFCGVLDHFVTAWNFVQNVPNWSINT